MIQRISKRKLMKRVASAALVLSLLPGCSLLPEEEDSLQPPVLQKVQKEYEIVEVKRGNIERFITSTATATSGRNISVSFPETGGRLKNLFVNVGDLVKAGQPIAELDTGDLPMRIKLQKLNVEKRNIQLFEATTSELSTDDIRLRELDLKGERMVLDSLEKEYNKALLFAPMDGIVTHVDSLRTGEGVEALRTVAVIADPNDVDLVYEATEAKSLVGAKVDMGVEVTIKKTKYSGKVLQTPTTAPKSDVESVNRRNAKSLIIGIPSLPNIPLKIGEYADFKIFMEKRDNVIVIPRNGLRNYLGRNYVQVMENDRVKEIDVETGLTTNREVEIIKGLEVGQKVILNT
ncbi:efflux RND transporter periplasmic adaptor subunit [Paenibacillus spongiae]|uniref:Efflux RND transporter periplasmic adaptor subunit n=1 Tax=Paenibacillus spongiae TaxID=2909671 RepID=A0ABY5S7R2_9BACL|nr:efflux RND transporter periplasmic adaptor subunit [Paenibacillus spongiae]UVI28872.1 efflux RND transporter periplasmic adaptor subunit [Paenibacillus spongiae]